MKYCSSKLSLGLKKGDYLWIILLLTLTTQKYNLETDYEALEWKGLGKRIKCTWVCWNLFGKPQWMWVNLKPKGAEVETLNLCHCPERRGTRCPSATREKGDRSFWLFICQHCGALTRIEDAGWWCWWSTGWKHWSEIWGEKDMLVPKVCFHDT